MSETICTTAQEQADKQGFRLIARATMPNDPHLELVLCECGGFEPYATWYFNKECGGFHTGIYRKTLREALDAFDKRAKHYGSKIIPLVSTEQGSSEIVRVF